MFPPLNLSNVAKSTPSKLSQKNRSGFKDFFLHFFTSDCHGAQCEKKYNPFFLGKKSILLRNAGASGRTLASILSIVGVRNHPHHNNAFKIGKIHPQTIRNSKQ